MTAGARSASLFVLASAFLFGTTGTAQELGPEAASPAVVGAARIAVGGALLVAVAAATGALRGARLDRLLLVAGLGVAGYQVSFFAAVDATGVAIGTIVALGSAPALTGALEWAVRGEVPDRRWVAATALATAGAVLLVASGESIGVDALGVLLALGAGLSYAVYTIASKAQLDRGAEPTAVMAGAFGLGAVVLAPLLVLGENDWLAEPGGWALALYLGVFPTAIAYLLFVYGLRRLTAANVATLTLAEPLTAATLGVVVLDERPSFLAVVGAALVLAGLLTLTSLRKERAESVPPL